MFIVFCVILDEVSLRDSTMALVPADDKLVFHYTAPANTSPNVSDMDMRDNLTTTAGAVLDAGYHYAYGKELYEFSVAYRAVHGYLAVIICILGIIANILNIVVLTRTKEMRTPTNLILTGLAVSDGLTMAAYLPFALHFYCLYGTAPSPERNTLHAVRYMLFFACFSVYVHTVSIWLTMTLAIFRYVCVSMPSHGKRLCSKHRAKIAIFMTYIVTLVACVPNFVTLNIISDDVGNNQTVWYVAFKLETTRENQIYNFNFWVQAIFVKLLPCVGLTILSFLLVRTMRQSEKTRQNLTGRQNKTDKRNENTNRATRMLLTVVALFLLTEFPQGILSLLSGILPHFVNEVYGPLGDVMDILALLNNGINFILYCTMSKQFRDTFIDIFFRPLKSKVQKYSTVVQVPPATTGATTTTTVDI